jgi:hypothetical protein
MRRPAELGSGRRTFWSAIRGGVAPLARLPIMRMAMPWSASQAGRAPQFGLAVRRQRRSTTYPNTSKLAWALAEHRECVPSRGFGR